MTEHYSEPTRYLAFKLDWHAAFLAPHLRDTLEEISKEPEGATFNELLERVSYKGGFMGPRLLKASLKHLFDRDYIITNYQMARLKEKQGIDTRRVAPKSTPAGYGRFRMDKRRRGDL